MIRDHDPGMEGFNRVDVSPPAHFRNALGVAEKVEALATVSEHVAVAASLVVE